MTKLQISLAFIGTLMVGFVVVWELLEHLA